VPSWLPEFSLVQTHAQAGVGIFGCSAQTVFSDKLIWLRPGVSTSVVQGNLVAYQGGPLKRLLNTEIYTRVWRKVFEDGAFHEHDWTVKVDPHTVFLPGRLLEHVRSQQSSASSLKLLGLGEPRGVFFSNCGYGLHGPIETVSRHAVLHLRNGGLDRCINESVSDWSVEGEDAFLAKCMSHLGTKKVNDFGLLSEEFCGEKPSPCVSGKVAFHPFTDAGTWFQCLKQAQR